MIRILSLTIVALLLLAGYFLPSADGLRMAAFRTGVQLESPLVELSGPGWRGAVDVGDRVRLEMGGTGIVDKVEGDLIWMTGDPGADGEPAQEYMPMPQALMAEWLSSSRTLLSVLSGPVGVKQIGEVGEQKSQVLLGTVELRAPDLETKLSPVEGSTDARRSVIRKLRSSIENLSDHNLEIPTPGAVSLVVEALEDSRTRITATTLTGLTFASESRSQAPSLLTLLPPLIAIILAILFRRPVLSLFFGVLGGSWLVEYLAGKSFGAMIGLGSLNVVDTYLKNVLVDQFYYQIMIFVIAMLAMVGIMTRAGGVQGLMDRISRLAHNARRTQIATWLMGLAIFFDDYANTILVGSTMRPLTDRYKVAREKLAYIVDSTAAPVAGLSLLSTWIAFEVSTFSHALPDAGLSIGDGYAVFLHTLPYRFYCLFTLFFVGLVVISGRDFGPMLRAEERARGGQLLNPGSKPMVSKEATDLEMEAGVQPRAINAVLPLLVFVFGTLGSILYSGGAFMTKDMSTFQGWTEVLYDGSGAAPLMYGALAGLLVAIVLGLKVGVRKGLVTASISSIRSMGIAIAILYLAWMLGAVCTSLGTSTYLTVQLGDTLPPLSLPVALFLLSALVAFSTGSSWTTMTILLPLVVGLSFRLGEESVIGGYLLMVMSIGAVLEGAIFGDHCSPISDTTVMSSIASASDHIDHVRTQMPYALLTMGTALIIGYLPAAYLAGQAGSWLPFACLGVGALVLTGVLFTIGRKAKEPGGT
ncbi:MAG: Na+/H+ antiporter NhaC [Planctomycetota bacterium]|jgi:Na+/H+ antiporter NhaC